MSKRYGILIVAAIFFSMSALAQFAYALNCIENDLQRPFDHASHHSDATDTPYDACPHLRADPDGAPCRQLLKEIKSSTLRAYPKLAKGLQTSWHTHAVQIADHRLQCAWPDHNVDRQNKPLFILNAALLC